MNRIILTVVILMIPSLGWADLSVINQAGSSFAVTPSDTTVYNPPTRALFNGSAAACNIALKLLGDTAATTFQNVQSGATLPYQVKSVMATNTTCTGIVGLY